MDDITIGVTENVNNILVTAQPNDQTIDITVTETVETVLLDVSTTVAEVTVTATQNVIVENITVDYVNNENNIDINVTDSTQDVTLNITPTLVEINILRSGGEVNILQFDSLADFPATGSSDYFYLAKDTNKLYRWTGSAYAEISATANAVWGQIIGTLSEQTDLQNALNLKAPINSPTFTGTVSGITKTMVGLGAVDNTSDLDKPISTATQTALNNKQPLDADLTSIAALSDTFGLLKKTANNSYTIDTNTYLTGITSSDVTTALGYTPENVANKGVNNGYASLDGGGKVPSSQLPSYVDDVIEVANYASLPVTGETGKIYITLDTNKIYRWSGSIYVEVSSSTTVWGQITGTLSNQTDLQTALDAKQDDLNGTGFVKASGTTISYDNTTYYPASNPNGYTSNTGTVTSVALTVPSAFSVSGSPITSSGTLAVTATGNTTQYIAGDGSLVTFPTIGTAGTLIREVRNTTGATLTKGTVVYISGATGNKPTVSKALAFGDTTSAQTFGLVQADIANNANGNVVCAGDLSGLDTSALTEGVQLYLSSTTAGAYTTTKQLAPAHLVYIGIVTRAHPTLGQIEVNIQNGYELYELHDVSITSVANNDGLFYEASSDLWKNKSIATVLGYTPANGADYMALSGSQTISGDKTFSGAVINDGDLYLKQDATYIPKSGYTNLFASGKTININFGSTINAVLDFTSLSSDRTYTFPNASGTIALTSDIPSLAGYVPTSRTITINGTTFDLSADRSYTIATGTGTVTSVAALTLGTAGTDLSSSVANGTTTPVITLNVPTASATNRGALSAADWTTFNNKQAALGYTAANDANVVHTTGNESISGVKTFTTAVHSNILKFSESAGFNQTAGYTQIGGTADYFAFANGGNTKSAQFNYNGSSAVYTLPATTGTLALTSELHNAVTIGTANGLSLSTQVLSLALASTSTTGALSSTDWNTFNGKQNALTNPVTGTGTTSYLPKFTGTSAIGNSLLYDTGSVLLVGATSASDAQSKLELVSAGTVGLKIISSGANGNNTFLSIQASKEWRFVTNRGDLISGNQGDLIIRNNTDGINHIILNQGGATTFVSSVTATSGIFTQSAGNSLQVYQTTATNATTAIIRQTGAGGNGGQDIGLLVDIQGANDLDNIANFRYFDGSTYTSRMVVKRGGNVGIGTTSPASNGMLQIVSSSGTLGDSSKRRSLVVMSTTAENADQPGVILGYDTAGAGIIAARTSATGQPLAFWTYNGSSWGERMRITSGGNVGIGTTSPESLLHLSQASVGGEGAFIFVDNPATSTLGNKAGIRFATNLGASFSGYGSFIEAINTNAGNGAEDLTFGTWNGSSRGERMRITSGGRLLVGQTSASAASVNGACIFGDTIMTGSFAGIFWENRSGGVTLNSNWYGWYTTSGTIYLYNGASNVASINPSSGAYTALSDINKKKDFEDSAIGLNAIMGLKPKLFRMKDQDESSSKQLGFIAQEVKDFIPQAYVETKGEKENFIGLDDRPIIAALTKAVQELKAELDTLKNK